MIPQPVFGYPVLHFSDIGYLSRALAILFYTSQTYDTLASFWLSCFTLLRHRIPQPVLAILFYTSQTQDILAGCGYPVLHFSDIGYLSRFLAILFYTSQTQDILAGFWLSCFTLLRHRISLHFSDIGYGFWLSCFTLLRHRIPQPVYVGMNVSNKDFCCFYLFVLLVCLFFPCFFAVSYVHNVSVF